MASLDKILRAGLVAEKVCMVDRTPLKTLMSPYGSQPTTVVQPLCGTYATAAYTLADSTLTVTDEFIVAEHVLDFENALNNFDVMADRMDEMNYSVLTAIDKYVVNGLCKNGGSTYTTPVGGFTTAANVGVICSNILAKVAGYAETYKGLYCIVENTDLTGIVQYESTNGFSYADAALNNGFVKSIFGIDFYVVRSGTFVTEQEGYIAYTNSNHRVAGVKNVSTYAAPRGITVEEKMVTGLTGRELVTFGYIGFKQWYATANLTINITLA